MRNLPFMVVGCLFLFMSACNTPPCIICQDVEGFPQGTICRDTYETTTLPQSPHWDEFSQDALQAGCTTPP